MTRCVEPAANGARTGSASTHHEGAAPDRAAWEARAALDLRRPRPVPAIVIVGWIFAALFCFVMWTLFVLAAMSIGRGGL